MGFHHHHSLELPPAPALLRVLRQTGKERSLLQVWEGTNLWVVYLLSMVESSIITVRMDIVTMDMDRMIRLEEDWGGVDLESCFDRVEIIPSLAIERQETELVILFLLYLKTDGWRRCNRVGSLLRRFQRPSLS